MEREPDEMSSLGVLGICKEAYNILHLHLRFFLSLAVTLVLPLGVLIFCHGFVVDPLWIRIQSHSHLDAEKIWLTILALIYYVFVFVFSLLSTAAIVYTVASIHTAEELSYVKVLNVVPKVWKRLFMTFFCAYVFKFLCSFAYDGIVGFLFLLALIMRSNLRCFSYLVLVVLACLVVYILLVWLLASVVSVLEDTCGLGALRKSSELIKGKRWVACSVFLIYAIFTSLVLWTYNVYVRDSTHLQSVFGRLIVGVLLLLLWTAFTLIGIVMQTVVYFVCKSYHQESIDLSALSEHLDGSVSEYTPLQGPVSLEACVETRQSDV